MLSPAAFANGASTDPLTHNSCHVGWDSDLTLTCAGITAVAGTGPWQYAGMTCDDDTTATTYGSTCCAGTASADGSCAEGSSTAAKSALFNKNAASGANAGYWGGAPSLDSITVQYYATHADVKAALIAGTLDVAIGSGVLAPADLRDIEDNQAATLSVHMGPVLQTRIVILNGNSVPTDNIETRKAIIHAVDKAAIIDAEMSGYAEVEDALFTRSQPYCDLDLTPRWDYDLEKAEFINCRPERTGPVVVGSTFLTNDLDPTDGSSGWSLTSHGISENLFTVDKDGNIVGVIAESATKVSEFVWDVTLKAGYRFSDGTAVTAARVAAALTEMNTANSAAQSSLGTMTVTTPVTVPVSSTVRIQSTKATHVMESVLAEWAFPIYYKDSSNDYIFTGPYKVTSFTYDTSVETCVDDDSSGDDCTGFVAGNSASCGDCDYTPPAATQIDLEPNPFYGHAASRPDTIIKKFATGDALAEAAMRDELDIGFHLPIHQVSSVAAVRGQNVVSFETGYHYMMVSTSNGCPSHLSD